MSFYDDLLEELGHSKCDDSCTDKAMHQEFVTAFVDQIQVMERQRIEDALLEVFQKYSMATKLKVDIYNTVWPK